MLSSFGKPKAAATATMFYLAVVVVTVIVSMTTTSVTGSTIPVDFKYGECNSSYEICEYWFVIQEKLTMIYDGVLVYGHNGTLIKYDEFPDNYTTKVYN